MKKVLHFYIHKCKEVTDFNEIFLDGQKIYLSPQ